jgi:hypothetical protein
MGYELNSENAVWDEKSGSGKVSVKDEEGELDEF